MRKAPGIYITIDYFSFSFVALKQGTRCDSQQKTSAGKINSCLHAKFSVREKIVTPNYSLKKIIEEHIQKNDFLRGMTGAKKYLVQK